MPTYRYTGKSPMRVGCTEVRGGAVLQWDYNPDPRRFTEVHEEVGSEAVQPAVAEATPIKVQWRKPRAVTNEEEA